MSKEFKVGTLVVISLVVLYFGFSFLKGQDFMNSESNYFVIYDNVNGLTKSNPVKLNGLAVGRVAHIKILSEQENKLKVTISISNSLEVGDGTIATLKSSGPLGGSEIDLVMGTNKVAYEGGEEIRSHVEGGISAIFQEKGIPMMENISSLLASTDGLVQSVDSVLIRKTIGDLSITMSNLKKSTYGLDKKMAIITNNLVGLSQSLNKMSGTMNSLTEEEIKPLMGKFNGIASKLEKADVEKTITELNKSIASLTTTLTALNEGKGTMGKIMKDPALYNNLNKAITDISELMNHLDKDPRHFFAPLGKKQKKGNVTK